MCHGRRYKSDDFEAKFVQDTFWKERSVMSAVLLHPNAMSTLWLFGEFATQALVQGRLQESAPNTVVHQSPATAYPHPSFLSIVVALQPLYLAALVDMFSSLVSLVIGRETSLNAVQIPTRYTQKTW